MSDDVAGPETSIPRATLTKVSCERGVQSRREAPANGEKNLRDVNAMKTESTSTILHLTGKMKRPTIPITRRAKRGVRSVTSLVCFGVLFSTLIATAFYSPSSASTQNKVSRDARQQSPVSSSKAAGRALTSREN